VHGVAGMKLEQIEGVLPAVAQLKSNFPYPTSDLL